MLRSNHYEVAFEAYLRARGVGFVAVDEAKRSELGGTAVKSVEQLRSVVSGSRSHVALLVQRGDARVFVPVELG